MCNQFSLSNCIYTIIFSLHSTVKIITLIQRSYMLLVEKYILWINIHYLIGTIFFSPSVSNIKINVTKCNMYDAKNYFNSKLSLLVEIKIFHTTQQAFVGLFFIFYYLFNFFYHLINFRISNTFTYCLK